ncbi:MAG: hypothetical protein Homavirus40_1, partial [Homavirus sp.]
GDVTRLWFSTLRQMVFKKYQKFAKEFITTNSKKSATTITVNAINDGYNIIVSVGGDGTHNEIINGYMEADGKNKHVCLVIAPITSDLSKMIYGESYVHNIGDLYPIFQTEKFNKADMFCNYLFDIIDNTNTVEYDVGCMKSTNNDDSGIISRYFINSCAVGFSGFLGNVSKTSGWNNFLSTCKQLVTWTNKPIRFKIDSNEYHTANIYQMVISNNKYSGGILIAPNASIYDGNLDLMVFDDMNIKDISIIKDIYYNTHTNYNKVKCFIGSVVIAEPTNSFDSISISIDGEEGGKLPAMWSIISNAVVIKN